MRTAAVLNILRPMASRLVLAIVLSVLAACETLPEGNLPPSGNGAEKVGVIDIQAVFERSRVGKRALDALIAEFGEHRRRLAEEDAMLKTAANQLDQEKSTAPPEQIRRHTEQYLARLEEYRVQVQAFNQDLARRHRALVNDYLPKIIAVAKPLAEREGFSTVLHRGRPETVLIVFYRSPEIDLTDRVIAALDRQPGPSHP